ncbi:chitosanase [Streptomyces sp. PTM05]|uniref:Chitosanase n=1 Tax=Streptantibioticus parmotrematis TaxID=2873249 RepID=A0ABS7QKR7_9ACTN|nr:chitosanase [Streptantibioticus parmotrematis]MBY8883533.1 chitosanase [Streptantibioticus parmotrematis]
MASHKRAVALTTTGVAAALTVAFVPTAQATGTHPAADRPAKAAGISLTDDQRYAIDEITNVFENGDITSGFAAIEDYGDGCGYTAGYIGFCTQTDDDVKLVTYYDSQEPSNPLAKYLPALKKLAAAGSDAHTGLGGFTSAWKQAAKDPVFVQAQFEQAHVNYLDPALAEAQKVGITSALGVANFFDTAVEMGPDGAPDSPDGLLVLVSETTSKAGGTPASGVDEHTWLGVFNQVRTAHLKNPKTPGRKSDWPDSVDRVQALQQMASAGEWNLPLPLHVGADFDYTIPKRSAGSQI